jgi:hypothetical protein
VRTPAGTRRFLADVVPNADQLFQIERLIAFLSSEAATAAIRNSGMQPSRPH